MQTSVVTNACNEIATGTKNVFLVPYGKTGRNFIDQVTSHINEWNNGANCQQIALLAVGLQTPSPESKAKEHQELLSTRLVQRKEGEIDKLLREGRIIQSLIRKCRSDKSKVFTKLVFEGHR